MSFHGERSLSQAGLQIIQYIFASPGFWGFWPESPYRRTIGVATTKHRGLCPRRHVRDHEGIVHRTSPVDVFLYQTSFPSRTSSHSDSLTSLSTSWSPPSSSAASPSRIMSSSRTRIMSSSRIHRDSPVRSLTYQVSAPSLTHVQRFAPSVLFAGDARASGLTRVFISASAAAPDGDDDFVSSSFFRAADARERE